MTWLCQAGGARIEMAWEGQAHGSRMASSASKRRAPLWALSISPESANSLPLVLGPRLGGLGCCKRRSGSRRNLDGSWDGIHADLSSERAHTNWRRRSRKGQRAKVEVNFLTMVRRKRRYQEGKLATSKQKTTPRPMITGSCPNLTTTRGYPHFRNSFDPEQHSLHSPITANARHLPDTDYPAGHARSLQRLLTPFTLFMST